ncbi:MAG: hypothetical protein GF363_02960 [Chitinivibrionales bacterium]|nr:hypothetical protein [Chitinivibrionales bacterium]
MDERTGDEIDSLVRMLGVPARFGSHNPHFSVSEREFTFNHAAQQGASPTTEKLWVIYDHDRVVGYLKKACEFAEGLRLIGFDPTNMPKALNLPTGRLHHDTELGPVMQSCKCYDSGEGLKSIPEEVPYEFEVAPSSVMVRRRYKGQVNTLVLSCDPVLGYTVEAEHTIGQGGEAVWVAKAMSPGTYEPWPQRIRYRRVAYTPAGTQEYRGFYTSNTSLAWANAKQRQLSIRDGGFVAFLEDSRGWGCAFCRLGGGDSLRAKVCEAHNIWHQQVQVPEDRIIRQRLVGLPPEINEYLCDRLVVETPVDARFVQIALDEDFESWPYPITSSIRGIVLDRPKISLRTNGDGTSTCLVFSSDLVSKYPQIGLEPGSHYRCRARLMAESGTAYISGRTYEWSPRNAEKDGTWYREYCTDSVKEGEGWREVSFDVTTPAWDPFIDIRFHVENGTACLDSFALKKVVAGSESNGGRHIR